MAANTVPIFCDQGNFFPVAISAANTASDGSGSLVTLVTAGVDGTRVEGVRFKNAQVTAAASSANLMKVFLSDATGANFRNVGEVTQAAATRSATVAGATSVYTFDQPVIMRTGQILSVAMQVYAGAQDLTHAIAFANDY